MDSKNPKKDSNKIRNVILSNLNKCIQISGVSRHALIFPRGRWWFIFAFRQIVLFLIFPSFYMFFIKILLFETFAILLPFFFASLYVHRWKKNFKNNFLPIHRLSNNWKTFLTLQICDEFQNFFARHVPLFRCRLRPLCLLYEVVHLNVLWMNFDPIFQSMGKKYRFSWVHKKLTALSYFTFTFIMTKMDLHSWKSCFLFIILLLSECFKERILAALSMQLDEKLFSFSHVYFQLLIPIMHCKRSCQAFASTFSSFN